MFTLEWCRRTERRGGGKLDGENQTRTHPQDEEELGEWSEGERRRRRDSKQRHVDMSELRANVMRRVTADLLPALFCFVCRAFWCPVLLSFCDYPHCAAMHRKAAAATLFAAVVS